MTLQKGLGASGGAWSRWVRVLGCRAGEAELASWHMQQPPASARPCRGPLHAALPAFLLQAEPLEHSRSAVSSSHPLEPHLAPSTRGRGAGRGGWVRGVRVAHRAPLQACGLGRRRSPGGALGVSCCLQGAQGLGGTWWVSALWEDGLGGHLQPLCLPTAGPAAFQPEAQQRSGPARDLLQQAHISP